MCTITSEMWNQTHKIWLAKESLTGTDWSSTDGPCPLDFFLNFTFNVLFGYVLMFYGSLNLSFTYGSYIKYQLQVRLLGVNMVIDWSYFIVYCLV